MRRLPGRNDLQVELIFGAGRVDRRVSDVEKLLVAYRDDSGSEYLDYQSSTPQDVVVPEDLAVTTLVNSRFGMEAFRSLARHGAEVDLTGLPDLPLEETSEDEREQVAAVVATVANWPGLAASTATKVLHKKRPRLIPILDNQAIFGAYMNSSWPESPSLTDSVKAHARIRQALDWIAVDLTRSENDAVWPALEKIEPSRSRIEIFDSVWWIHFRQVEPVDRSAPRTSASTEAREGANAPDARSWDGDEAALVFSEDEDGYRAWIETHPTGYVLNSYRTPSPTYLKLHRASCGRIRGTPPRGSTWTSPYIKVCANERADIEWWAADVAGGAVTVCGWCHP